MKKTIKNIVLSSLIISAAFSACKKATFNDNFYNPEAAVEADIPKLFSGLLFNQNKASSNTIMPRYWNLYVFQMPTLGTYTQLFGYTESIGQYEQKTAYSQSRWEYYYTAPLASYREINRVYDQITEKNDKEGYHLFLQASKIFLYDQTAQMIDMWGDIPFSEAGQVISTGGTIINAKYDDQQELYNQMIDDLKVIADDLNTDTTALYYKQMFDKADLLNGGKVEKWKIYANSLRLRLAMRMSFTNDAKAQQVVNEIISNPTLYPVVSTINNAIKIDAKGDQLRSVIGVDGIKVTFESKGYNYAPGHIINNVMNPSADPRLQVLFSKNINGKYVGLDPNLDGTTQENQINAKLISRIDSATFSRNDKFPGIVITPAEISFLKAEANERWGIGNAAETEYQNGIKQSIEFWYYVNSLNDNVDGTAYVPKTKPSDSEINTFLAHELIAYAGSKEEKLEKIATQNWVNFSVIQAQHAWAEYRRTKYPKLVFSKDNSSSTSPLPPSRLLYPENERTYNTIHYQAVKAKDNVTTKIFWDVK